MSRASDVIIIGGGIIGVSLALELSRRGASVRIFERGEPGHEASWAGAGMLAARDPDTPECLRALTRASSEMYPEWVAELEEGTNLKADLRLDGTIYVTGSARQGLGEAMPAEELGRLEPEARAVANRVYVSDEGSVDPRALMAVTLAAAKKRGVFVTHEHEVTDVEISDGKACGVRIGNKPFPSDVVINCAGAWAGKVRGVNVPAHPVKGQMLSVVPAHHGKLLLKHVVRGDEVYLVPRSDGRILIGATVEKIGFNKRVVPETILDMKELATGLVPKIAGMKIHESWAGLRPGSPDKLPIMGETVVKNYFVATGHYRNGILLAPITAKVMADVIIGSNPGFELGAFSPARFT